MSDGVAQLTRYDAPLVPTGSRTVTHTPHWRLFIDTGGTFTDCVAIDPAGATRRCKVLSTSTLRTTIDQVIEGRFLAVRRDPMWANGFLRGFHVIAPDTDEQLGRVVADDAATGRIELDRPVAAPLPAGRALALRIDEEAPILAARVITGTPPGMPLPPIDMRLATTRATNALLERTIDRVAFFVTRGFADLLAIGDQTRPDLFALEIHKPRPFHDRVIEVDERLDARGSVLRALDCEALERDARAALRNGFNVAAVALMHASVNPRHEREAERRLLAAGFRHVSASAALSPLIRIVPRATTTVINAAVSGVIDGYFDSIERSLGAGGRLRVMSSAGEIAARGRTAAKDCLLSGPAGGVLGAAAAGRASGFDRVIGLDMGGTSTDACRFDREFEYRFEHEVAGAHVFTPSLGVETIAAGGGSICDFIDGRLTIGPRSAGAAPGPACYGAGGPLTLTDVNLLLGRIDADRFEIPLDARAAERTFVDLHKRIEGATGETIQPDILLQGFINIADERMAGAIARVSVREGVNPADFTLVAFGGAGGQHACGVATRLGIRTVLLPADGSLLSAAGLRDAAIERIAGRQALLDADAERPAIVELIRQLAAEAHAGVAEEGVAAHEIDIARVIASLRLRGQDATLQIDGPSVEHWRAAFDAAFRATFGHAPDDRPLEVESIRVVARQRLDSTTSRRTHQASSNRPALPAHPAASDTRRMIFGATPHDAVVLDRRALAPGDTILGPALILDRGTSMVVAPGWRASTDAAGAVLLTRAEPGDGVERRAASTPIERELFAHRCEVIAREMGEQLQRTALSTNVKERRDFSCAILDSHGRLLINAPHIPVHLGALGLCVRAVAAVIDMRPGDVVATNHPAFGGSHLPDITVIAPVHTSSSVLLGYVANRAHHAEIGGTRPGSMPPNARRLSQEGVVIAPRLLIRAGSARWDELERLFRSAPHPSRAVRDNLADLRAAVAANERGATALRSLAANVGVESFVTHAEWIQRRAASLARDALRCLPLGLRAAEDFMDDGTPIRVAIDLRSDRTLIDFAGTGPAHHGNLNATPAIVHSAVMYVLRALIGASLPLSEGVMDAVEVRLPPDCILNPTFDADPSHCPAVVGGNTETSQRVVDVLLKAFDAVAASQGTMNNLLFGNETFGYYETISGGAGAGNGFHGCPAVHTHMTNTRLTDPEILEQRYPARLDRFGIRRGSGGTGRWRGGDGVIRELTFLAPVALSLLTQRRRTRPFGMHGGEAGQPGRQQIIRRDGRVEQLGSIDARDLDIGDRLIIETPGGGGWGDPAAV
jgi:5-oxoprolinase (ATP-hydrolysing)